MMSTTRVPSKSDSAILLSFPEVKQRAVLFYKTFALGSVLLSIDIGAKLYFEIGEEWFIELYNRGM
jgi:hypothetical protein